MTVRAARMGCLRLIYRLGPGRRVRCGRAHEIPLDTVKQQLRASVTAGGHTCTTQRLDHGPLIRDTPFESRQLGLEIGVPSLKFGDALPGHGQVVSHAQHSVAVLRGRRGVGDNGGGVQRGSFTGVGRSVTAARTTAPGRAAHRPRRGLRKLRQGSGSVGPDRGLHGSRGGPQSRLRDRETPRQIPQRHTPLQIPGLQGHTQRLGTLRARPLRVRALQRPVAFLHDPARRLNQRV